MNVRAAGLSNIITIQEADFADFKKPADKSIIVMNPPYGERISTPNLLATYRMIGERLKHEFSGNEAWVLSYREECFEQIGLKPSIKIPLFNGSLECEFRRYALFDGKMKEFRSEGGIVKTEEERRQMAEKRRFKKNREFKKRLDEEEENALSDIRSFKFYSMERRAASHDNENEKPNVRKGHDKDDFSDRKTSRKEGKTFHRDNKKRPQQGRDFGHKGKRNAFGSDRKYGKKR